MSTSSADRDPLDRLAEEFVARFRAGERPSLTEYAARLPDRADEVRDLFPALVELEQLKPNTADQTNGYVTTVEPSDPVRLGDFRILRRVGQGGMGVVYEAVQESLGRHVALKLLPAEALMDPKKLERFRREAKAAARLHHTNIVPVFGTGEADGRHFYAMQFISGHPLDAVIDEVKRLKEKSGAVAPAPSERAVSGVANALITGTFPRTPSPPEGGHSFDTTLPAANPPSGADAAAVSSPSLSDGGRAYWATVARLGAQAADALAYAHAQGVLHRDIKPSNLLLDLHGTIWITDFGLAKASDADDLTQMGDIVGTLRYMAPERFEGTGDHRADIYALGLTLYELLTLTPAFSASNRAKLVEQAIAANPPRPRSINPTIPKDLETIVLKAIARDPAMRYQSASDLADDLRRYQEDRPIRTRRASSAEQAFRWCRRNPAVAGLLTAVLLVFALGAGVSWYFAAEAEGKERDARDEAKRADGERDRANKEADAAHKEQAFTRHLLYDSQMTIATTALGSNRIAQLLLVMDDMRPKPGEPDLRGWEWHYLDRLTRTDRSFPLERGETLPANAPPGVDPAFANMMDPALTTHMLAAFNHDGRWLASPRRTDGGTVVDIYETATGQRTGQIPKAGVLSFPPNSQEVLRITLANDAKHLLLTDVHRSNGNVPPNGNVPLADIPRHWDVSRGEPVTTTLPKIRLWRARSVVVGPDAAWVAWLDEPSPLWGRNGPYDITVSRWEWATGMIVPTQLTIGVGTDAPTLGPDGRTVFWVPYAEQDGRRVPRAAPPVFEFWDVAARERRWSVPVLGRWGVNIQTNVTMSASGAMVMVVGPKEVTVLRASDGVVQWKADLPQDLPLSPMDMALLVSDDGNRIVFKWPHTLLVIENRPDGPPVSRRILFREQSSRLGEAGISTPKLLPDGRTLAGLQPGLLRLWDVSRDPEETSPEALAAVRARSSSKSQGPPALVINRWDGEARSPDGKRTAKAIAKGTPPPGSSPFGVNPTFSGPVVVTENGREVARVETPADWAVDRLQFLESGLLHATLFAPPNAAGGGFETRWAIYDPAAGGKLVPVSEGSGQCARIPETPYLLADDNDPHSRTRPAGTREYRILHAATGKEAYRRTSAAGEEFVIGGDSFHPASGRFAEVAWAKKNAAGEIAALRVRVCEIATGKKVWAADLDLPRDLGGATVSVAITPDGQRLLVEAASMVGLPGIARMEHVTNLWVARFADGGNPPTIQTTFPLGQYWGRPSSARQGYSPDGREVVLAVNNEVQTWNLETGELVHRLPRHPDPVTDVFYTDDRSRIFTVSQVSQGGELQLHVWDAATDREVFTMPLVLPPPPPRKFDPLDPGRRPVGVVFELPGVVGIDGGKIFLRSGSQVRVLDGTPVPEPKK